MRITSHKSAMAPKAIISLVSWMAVSMRSTKRFTG
jgi:hypothetical protein